MSLSVCKITVNIICHIIIRGKKNGYDKHNSCNFNHFTVGGAYFNSINIFSNFGNT